MSVPAIAARGNLQCLKLTNCEILLVFAHVLMYITDLNKYCTYALCHVLIQQNKYLLTVFFLLAAAFQFIKKCAHQSCFNSILEAPVMQDILIISLILE